VKNSCWGVLFVLGFQIQNAYAQDTSLVLERMLHAVYFLASDSLQGRGAGSAGAKLASNWIINRFEEVGIQPVMNKTYEQGFQYYIGTQLIQTNNLLAGTQGEKPFKILVTAHYDHLGKGNSHSLEVFKDKVHNGADDNASGVALLLSLAAWSQVNYPQGGILFGCFSGHEDGLYGADFFAKHAGDLLDSVQWMINLDMVGRLDTQQKPAPLYLRVPEKAENWLYRMELPKRKLLKTVIRPTATPLDYTPFFERGIKVVTLSTGVHPDYHKASDDAARINFLGMGEILLFTQKLLEVLLTDTNAQVLKTSTHSP
jgi:hypothetical protein